MKFNEATKKWYKIDRFKRKMLEQNVFCSTCGVTTIVNYNIEEIGGDLSLKGQCKHCHKEVARVIEIE